MSIIKYMNNYKIRLYPNDDQIEKFNNHIGACRFIWNHFLEFENNNYENGGKFIDNYALSKELTKLKKEKGREWLNDISNASMQKICSNLARAFKLFFKKKTRYPKFKSKKNSQTIYPSRSDSVYIVDDTLCFIAKIGRVKYKTDLDIPIGKNKGILNPRIVFDSGKWYLSFSLNIESEVECDYNKCDSQAFEEIPDKSLVGIDLGVKTLATVAFKDKCIKYPNINKTKKMKNIELRINHFQRSLARKYNTNGNYNKSNRIKKMETELNRLYKKQHNIRYDNIQQITSDILKLIPNRVVMEDLRVKNLSSNRCMSKHIMDSSFGTFIETMKYKCMRHGIQFKQVPSNYPSSKTCSCCGYIKKDLKLKDRTYICPKCGVNIDRDYNAAINLMNYNFS